MKNDPETIRLQEARMSQMPWKKWGPYLSERQWGTVREDYSDDGNAWDYFSHDQARSRAYHWGEDGLAGFSDDKQRLCFALALWNGNDPIIKERLFGLTNSEGNHGEDVKEYYFYLDSTPTHSYMKYLYKYPRNAYPYNDIVNTNKERTRYDPEYELLDTGIFDEDKYFDIFVEYAKASPEDILIKITAANRGPVTAPLHVLPTLWFRNIWTWWQDTPKPFLKQMDGPDNVSTIEASHDQLGTYFLYCHGNSLLLFTENETNNERISGTANSVPYVKDGINNYVVHGHHQAINPEKRGTKVSAHYKISIDSSQETVIQLRLSDRKLESPFGTDFDSIFENRHHEADEFYKSITPQSVNPDAAQVMRQALAGMFWTKQYYFYDVDKWLEEHGADPMTTHGRYVRNKEWFHMVNDNVISMPDKWEYPWYASWDLAFHTIAFSLADLDLAKKQLALVLSSFYLHPNGQIPAYEWNFSDVNPPVHAWSALFLNSIEKQVYGQTDIDFLQRVFRKLTLNFTWWVNRKDLYGKNVFQGGFLGLDNIGVFDRSAPLPTGGYLEQADGTAWMALFCQNMAEMSVELAAYDASYQELTEKFIDHFLWIANALNRMGDDGMWDEEDGFYYDLLRLPDGRSKRLKVRSMVGLLPLCATTAIEKFQRDQVSQATAHYQKRFRRMPELRESIHLTGPGHYGVNERGILALVNQERLKRILSRMLDENEFFSPYGIRSLSLNHKEHPYFFYIDRHQYSVQYLPGESDTGMFGGNSNWRGPIWFPVNVLIIRALIQYYYYYGNNFKVQCPTGSGTWMNLFEIAREIANRLISIFLKNEQGQRPVYGTSEKFQKDPHWHDYILFYEYFHGNNGSGLGASHQTGWTGLVATIIQLFGLFVPQELLESGKKTSLFPKQNT